MIRAPFARYPRAMLERMVQEGFDAIEQSAALAHLAPALPTVEFQILVAAHVYLQQTRPEET